MYIYVYMYIYSSTGRGTLNLLTNSRYSRYSTYYIQFDWEGGKCITGSIDRTCKIWDVKSGQLLNTLRGHNDEILDVSFNSTGSRLCVC